MKISNWFLCLFWAFPVFISAQTEVVLTVKSGSSTTTCSDFLGAADPLWRVNVDNQGWVVYDAANPCFTSFSFEQYRETYDCNSALPASIEVCFSAFENDDIGFELGLTCDLELSCEESICRAFAVPAPGDSTDYTLTLPDGGASVGSVTFTLATRLTAAVDNDDICNAVDLGTLEFGQTLGDAAQGVYSNLCATIENEINPFDIGGWINDAGVWFTFTTGDNPGHYLTIEALSDPESMGDSLGIELAIMVADNNACDGNLRLLAFNFNQPELDNDLSLICPQPNTRYFVMVDGGPVLGEDKRGFFGIQVSDIGVTEAPDDRCDAEDLGTIPEGGSVGTDGWRSNFCGTDTRDPFVRAFQSQHSVWFKFRAPPSGHIRIEGISDTSSRAPLGVQLALYRVSSGNCNGFFRHLESVYTFEDMDEVMEAQCLFSGEELYVLVDGDGGHSRGVFSLAVYDAGDITPVGMQDVTICAGQTFQAYRTAYDRSGTYRDTIPIFAGCDSVIVTNLTVLQTIEATVNTIQPALGAGAENGIAEVQAAGGEGNYSYLWCNGQTTARNERLAGGTECCVTVTDEQGCEDVVCFEIPQILPLAYTVQSDSLACSGDTDGTIRFQVTEDVPPYQYTWRKTDGSRSGSGEIALEGDTTLLSGLDAGSYLIELQGRYFDTSFTVEALEPAPVTLSLNALTEPSCHGFCDGALQVEASGGNGGYQWSWSDSRLSGPAPDNVCAGSYEVKVVDRKGCEATLTVQVEEPPPFVAEASTLKPVSCFEGQDGEVGVTTNGNPISHEWGSGQTGPVITGLVAGTYSVTVTNEDGCQAEASAVVTQPDLPVEVRIETEALISCADAGDGILRAAAAGPGQSFDFRWTNGTNEARNDRLGPGTYSVTISNEAGCTAESTATLSAPPPIEAQLTRKDITCLDPPDGGRIEVTSAGGGRPGYTFSIDGILFKTSPVFERLPEGAYVITVRDEAGCEADFGISVAGPPELTVSLGGDRVVQLGEIIRLTPASNSRDLTIAWNPLPESAKPGDPFLDIQPLESGRYAVEVMDNTTFCTARDEVLIQVKKDRKVFVPNVFSPVSREEANRQFLIYGGLGIEQIAALRIFDRQGGLVFSAEDFQPNDLTFAWDGSRNGQLLPSGVYVYVLEVSFIDGETEVFSGDVSLLR